MTRLKQQRCHQAWHHDDGFWERLPLLVWVLFSWVALVGFLRRTRCQQSTWHHRRQVMMTRHCSKTQCLPESICVPGRTGVTKLLMCHMPLLSASLDSLLSKSTGKVSSTPPSRGDSCTSPVSRSGATPKSHNRSSETVSTEPMLDTVALSLIAFSVTTPVPPFA